MLLCLSKSPPAWVGYRSFYGPESISPREVLKSSGFTALTEYVARVPVQYYVGVPRLMPKYRLVLAIALADKLGRRHIAEHDVYERFPSVLPQRFIAIDRAAFQFPLTWITILPVFSRPAAHDVLNGEIFPGKSLLSEGPPQEFSAAAHEF